MKRKGVSLGFVLIVLILGTIITTTLLVSSSNILKKNVKVFEKTLKVRKEKLMADSFLEWAISNGKNHMNPVSCSEIPYYDKFLDYLEEYEDGVWYDLAYNVEECADIDHEILKNELSARVPSEYLDELKALQLFYIKGATYAFLVSYADIDGGQFSWVFGSPFGTSSSLIDPGSPYNYLVFTRGSFSSTGGGNRTVDVYGPVLTSNRLRFSRSNLKVNFHDEVIAGEISNTKWASMTFNKDVVVRDLNLEKHSNLIFNGTVYASSVSISNVWGEGHHYGHEHGHTYMHGHRPRILEFNAGICASEVKIENTRELLIDDFVRVDDLKIDNVWGDGVDLNAIVCASNFEISKTSSLFLNKGVIASSIELDSIHSITFGGALNFEDSLRIENTPGDISLNGPVGFGKMSIYNLNGNLVVNSTACLKELEAEDFNTIDLKSHLKVDDLNVSNGYGTFSSEYMCGSNFSFSDIQNLSLDKFTALGDVEVENMRTFSVSDESSVAGDYTVTDDHWMELNVYGNTYVGGLLESNCGSSWGGDCFRGDLYLTKPPSVDPACVNGNVNYVPSSIFDDLSCECDIVPLSCPATVSNCFETAQASFDLIDHPRKVFDKLDVDAYIQDTRSKTTRYDSLCNLNLSTPTGISFDTGRFKLEYSNGEMIIRELNTGVYVKFGPNGCPPYDAFINCGSGEKEFKFNGIIFTEGYMEIGEDTRDRETYNVAGNVTFVSNADIKILKPIKYWFLGSDPYEWQSAISIVPYKDVYSFISRENLQVKVWRRSYGEDYIVGFSGVLISLEKGVSLFTKNRFPMVVLGSMISRALVTTHMSRFVTLVHDQRLTNPDKLCRYSEEIIVQDPFKGMSGGSGGNFEIWIRR